VETYSNKVARIEHKNHRLCMVLQVNVRDQHSDIHQATEYFDPGWVDHVSCFQQGYAGLGLLGDFG